MHEAERAEAPAFVFAPVNLLLTSSFERSGSLAASVLLARVLRSSAKG
jgi:hypothetical protein